MTSASQDMLTFLSTRRSASAKSLAAPGPDAGQLETILRIGTRVPDHGKYHPWYLLVFEGENRHAFGDIIAQAHARRDAEASPAKLELEAEKLLRAPLVIAVVSRIRPGKHPAWEQILSAGAVCYNLCLAANALGFGSNWLTEWIAYDDHVKDALELGPNDNIAGFIYIGTATEKQEERDRPDLSRIVTRWRKGAVLNTGDGYGFGAEMPRLGIHFKGLATE